MLIILYINEASTKQMLQTRKI